MSERDRTPVGGGLKTRCTKCKSETGHVVMAQNRDGIVSKVKCKACDNEHRYYSDEKRLLAKKKREKAVKAADNARIAEKYARLMEDNSDKNVIPYSMSGKYHVADVIAHKTFGKGAILKVSSAKMDVLFETGPRVLACNRKQA